MDRLPETISTGSLNTDEISGFLSVSPGKLQNGFEFDYFHLVVYV